MNRSLTASPAHANAGYEKCGLMRKKDIYANPVNLTLHMCNNRQVPRYVITHSQEHKVHKEHHFPIVSTHTHHRRWSANFCKSGTTRAVVVEKKKKEPQPPLRGVSLLGHTACHSSSKCYSCPAIGVLSSQTHPSCSSSSPSSSCCSSLPPVKTCVITGHDPLGWKLRPRSSSTSVKALTKRLSLQIPLPVIFPDPMPCPSPNSQSDNTHNPDPSPKTEPHLRAKSFRYHNSESSVFHSLPTAGPVVTLEDLCAVHLHQVTNFDESDVFSQENEKEVKMTTQPCKIPPPVQEKTPLARKIAQLIGHSRQSCKNWKTKKNIHVSIMKPKPKQSHQTEDQSSQNTSKTARLCVDTSCNKKRSTASFPGIN
uniref:uncharacterized protein n=1 Tax=Semicossyphus pulcher TaxID=241346 RepID=UPI0037E84142